MTETLGGVPRASTMRSVPARKRVSSSSAALRTASLSSAGAIAAGAVAGSGAAAAGGVASSRSRRTPSGLAARRALARWRVLRRDRQAADQPPRACRRCRVSARPCLRRLRTVRSGAVMRHDQEPVTAW